VLTTAPTAPTATPATPATPQLRLLHPLLFLLFLLLLQQYVTRILLYQSRKQAANLLIATQATKPSVESTVQDTHRASQHMRHTILLTILLSRKCGSILCILNLVCSNFYFLMILFLVLKLTQYTGLFEFIKVIIACMNEIGLFLFN